MRVIQQIMKKQSGYTLIELALTLVVIGVLATPAIALYHLNKVKKDYDNTGTSIAGSIDAIGDYRAAYGRYPCPAPANVDSSSNAYGLEDCSVAVRAASPRAGIGDIVIGILPFKSMNLQESDIYDAYGLRMTYAVTEKLTNPDTFLMSDGGIDLKNKNGDDLANDGHFVVLSHGQNGAGAYSRAGVLSHPCAGAIAETQNCDNDATFYIGNKDDEYDDRAGFFSSKGLSEWQLNDATSALKDQMYLKNAKSMALGVDTSDDLTNAEKLAVHAATPDGGTITTNNNKFQTNSICELGESITSADCFVPALLTQERTPQPTTANGLVCPANKPYFLGIDHGEPICSDEVTISCPTGMYLAGLNANREPLCRGTPPSKCIAKEITTFCGDKRTLLEEGHGEYSEAFSGQCYSFPGTHDANYVKTNATGKDEAQLKAFVIDLNNVDRVQTSCDSSVDTALVRDGFICDNANWKHIRAHERQRNNPHQFPTDYNKNAGAENAEHKYGYSKTIDLYGGSSQHDCWCREDYRLSTPACPNGGGKKLIIEKLRCPQTNNAQWDPIYESEENCFCAPKKQDTTQTCIAYYNSKYNPDITTGLTGSVLITHDYVCNPAGKLIKVPTPIAVDTNSCACPETAPIVNRTNCPKGTTNTFSWTLKGITYNETGVQKITTQEYNCPGGKDAYGLPTPGKFGTATEVPGIPACSCDNTYFEDKLEGCPPGKEGLGVTKRFVKNCVTGDMEDSGVVVKDECYDCKWNAGNQGEDSDFQLGGSNGQVGQSCTCGAKSIPVCWSAGGATKPYKTFTNCQCVVTTE